MISLLRFCVLNENIECSEFDCGSEELNQFLVHRALREMKQRLSSTVVVFGEGGSLLGYYTLSPAEIARDFLSNREGRGVPYSSVPGIRIGRLAVSRPYQGQGLGAKILKNALKKCLKASNEFGGRVVIVDAKDDQAASFYRRYGFKEIQQNPLCLVLRVSQLDQALTLPHG